MHLWTARIPVSLLHFELKCCTLLKGKFPGEFCSDTESVLTILSAAWNKTDLNSQIFLFLGDFLGMVGVVKSDRLDLESLWL